jgi:hypothetical protein
VSCTSAIFCVAVGWTEAAGTPYAAVPFVLNWNGSSWSTVNTEEPSDPDPSAWTFDDVTCLSASNCFAVGTTGLAGLISRPYDQKTLVEHWDGTNWSIVESATPDASGNARLNDVACTSTTSCNAVGEFERYVSNATPTRSLAEVYE